MRIAIFIEPQKPDTTKATDMCNAQDTNEEKENIIQPVTSHPNKKTTSSEMRKDAREVKKPDMKMPKKRNMSKAPTTNRSSSPVVSASSKVSGNKSKPKLRCFCMFVFFFVGEYVP